MDALAPAAPATDLPRNAAYEEQRRHTSIDLRVLEKIAHEAALSVPGVIRHSAAISQITGRRFPRIRVHMESGGRAAVAEIQIATAWPAPTVAIAQVTRETVAEWIEHSTGVPVLAVNVDIGAVVPVDGPEVTVQDLENAPRTPELTPVTATALTATAAAVTDRTPVHHPTPLDTVRLRPVTAPRPEPARRVSPPLRRPVLIPAVPAPLPLAPVSVAAGRPVAYPVTPVPPAVLHPRAPYSSSRPRPMIPVHVNATPVSVPLPPAGSPVTTAVPTPRGLPTRTVPTPEGLPLTIFPRARRARRIPVTVDRSRRWRSPEAAPESASETASDTVPQKRKP